MSERVAQRPIVVTLTGRHCFRVRFSGMQVGQTGRSPLPLQGISAEKNTMSYCSVSALGELLSKD